MRGGEDEATKANSFRHTHIVQININPAVVSDDEVSNRVHALDRVCVAVVGVQEPGIVRLNEFARCVFVPELEGKEEELEMTDRGVIQ